MNDFDPAYEWVEVTRLCDTEPRYARGRKRECPHVRRIPVESYVDPDLIVAQLCLTCDQQLHPRFVSRFDPPTTAELNTTAPYLPNHTDVIYPVQ